MRQLLLLAPMFLMLAWASVTDLRTRRIPNWLTLTLAVTGIVHSFLPGHLVTPLHSLLGLLTGFGLNLVLFVLHIRGGGDVKLFAGVGAWIGPLLTFEIFIVSILVAAVSALIQATVSGKLTALLRNTGILAVTLAHSRELGVAHVTRPDGTFRSVGRPVPYAVPVIIAAFLVLAVNS